MEVFCVKFLHVLINFTLVSRMKNNLSLGTVTPHF